MMLAAGQMARSATAASASAAAAAPFCQSTTTVASALRGFGRAARRHESSWTAPPRSVTAVSGVSVTSSISPVASVSARSSRSLVVYSTPMLRYMKGLGYALLGIIIPSTAYITWPILMDEQAAKEGKATASTSAIELDNGISPSASTSRTISAARTSSAAQTDVLSGSHVSSALIALNVALVASVLALARFNSRLVHTVRLYPSTRILALETVGLVRSASPRLVHLDALLPPLARSGHSEAIRCKIDVIEHPTATIEQAEGQATPAAASSPLSLTPLSAYHLFPLPNVATAQSDYTAVEKELLEQFWLRTLTTNLHTTDQMEKLAKINLLHGK